MAIEITDAKTPIQADDDYFVSVFNSDYVFVKVSFDSGVTGNVALTDAQGDAYKQPDDPTTAIVINASSDLDKFEVMPTGGKINFGVTSIGGATGDLGIHLHVIDKYPRT